MCNADLPRVVFWMTGGFLCLIWLLRWVAVGGSVLLVVGPPGLDMGWLRHGCQFHSRVHVWTSPEPHFKPIKQENPARLGLTSNCWCAGGLALGHCLVQVLVQRCLGHVAKK